MDLVDKYYDFAHYQMHVKNITDQIRCSGTSYSAVFGIAKGGVVPGVHISYVLGLPFHMLEWSSRRPASQDRSNHYLINYLDAGQNVLLVDHATLSGQTFFGIQQQYNSERLHFASLVCEKQENLPQILVNYKGIELARQSDPAMVGIRWWFKQL